MGKEKKHEDSGSYNYKMFNFFNRKFKINEVEPTADVLDAFERYAGDVDSGHLDAQGLCCFLEKHQGEAGITVAGAQRIIDEVIRRRHHVTRFTRHSLNLDDFFHFLFFDDLNPPITPHVHQDMTAPLSHYYIYTGHNSYLTGNQLSSDCSEVPIIKALQRGVRVIELDLWPNSTGTDINVLHGRTLTTPVSLIKCLKSIRDHAFWSSPYPVIITLEDHLTPELQEKVAEMAAQSFGEMLYYPDSEDLQEFPSPESLKYRIMISTKPPKEYLESRNPIVANKGNASPSSEEEPPGGHEEISTMSLERILREEAEAEAEAKGGSDSDLDEEVSGEDQKEEPATKYKRLAPVLDRQRPEATKCNLGSDSDLDEEVPGEDQKFGPATKYKRLITIHAGKPKGAVKDEMKKTDANVRRLSLSEQELEKTCASHGADVIKFTQRNILRIYPKGTRFNSSNYKPLIGWTHGTQMIAFNMQGYGRSLWLMHGMFRANGGCGYVKKPSFLMEKGSREQMFDPKVKLPVQKTLKVKVYMGDGWRLDFSHTHFDSYSPPDFYTKLHIVGVEADNAKKKTRVIEDNWYPIWDEEFSFPLSVPELALLRIVVKEYDMSDKDDFGGQTCLPVSELRPGIRSVPLHDKKGEKLKSVRLLMGFQFV